MKIFEENKFVKICKTRATRTERTFVILNFTDRTMGTENSIENIGLSGLSAHFSTFFRERCVKAAKGSGPNS